MESEKSPPHGSHNNNNNNNNTSASGKAAGNFGPYNVGKTIGRGAFAKVKVAEHVQTHQKVALKVISRRLTEANPMLLQKLRREIRILSALHHPHTTALFDVFQTESDIILVLEYVSHQDLQMYISVNGHVCEVVARRMFQQLISALDYCHRHRIAHRDIKAENVMLQGDELDIKLGDFGLSSILYDSTFFQTSCGTLHYSAPEVVSGLLYGIEADVWSAGVLLYAMIFGSLPFDNEDTQAMIHAVKTATYSFPDHPEVSTGVMDLIRKMLVPNPLHRPTMADILDHPWVSLKFPTHLITLRNIDIHETMQLGLEYMEDRERQCGEDDPDVRAVVANLYREPVEKVSARIQKELVKDMVLPQRITDCTSRVRRVGLKERSSSSTATTATPPLSSSSSSSASGQTPKLLSDILIKSASAMDAQMWPPSLTAIPLAKVVLRNRSHDMYIAFKLLQHQKLRRTLRTCHQQDTPQLGVNGGGGGGSGNCGVGVGFLNRVIMKDCTAFNSSGCVVVPSSPGLTLSMSTAYSGSGFLREDSSTIITQSATLDRLVDIRLSSDELWREGYNQVVTPRWKSATAPPSNRSGSQFRRLSMTSLSSSNPLPPLLPHSSTTPDAAATFTHHHHHHHQALTPTPHRLPDPLSRGSTSDVWTSRRLPDRLLAHRPREEEGESGAAAESQSQYPPSSVFSNRQDAQGCGRAEDGEHVSGSTSRSMHLLQPMDLMSAAQRGERHTTPHVHAHAPADEADCHPPIGSLTAPSFSFSPVARNEGEEGSEAGAGAGAGGGAGAGAGRDVLIAPPYPTANPPERAKPAAVEDVSESLRCTANSPFLALLEQQNVWPLQTPQVPPPQHHHPFKLLPAVTKLPPPAHSHENSSITMNNSSSCFTASPSMTVTVAAPTPRFGELIRNGVLFDASSSRSTMRHVYQALKEEGFVWKVRGPFSLTCIKQPYTRLNVCLYKMSDSEQVVDFRIAPICGMPAVDDCARLVERLRSLSDRLSRARELRLSKRPLSLFE